MKKEELLAASRKEKDLGREYESRVFIKSQLISSVVALLLGLSMCLIQYLVNGTVNIALLIVGLTASGTQTLFEGIKIKKVWPIVGGSLQLLVSLIFLIYWIVRLVEA